MKVIIKSIREESCKVNSESFLDEQIIAYGYLKALDDFGIWKDGKQTIGCMNYDVADIVKAVREEFNL